MKRVLIFLGSVLSLLFISFIILELLNFYEINFTLTHYVDLRISVLLIFGISLGVPISVILLIAFGKFIVSLFKPKFIRIAGNLERSIKRNKHIGHKLDIPLRKEHIIDKMEHIWMKAEMQYPLSELDFDKIMGGNPDA